MEAYTSFTSSIRKNDKLIGNKHKTAMLSESTSPLTNLCFYVFSASDSLLVIITAFTETTIKNDLDNSG